MSVALPVASATPVKSSMRFGHLKATQSSSSRSTNRDAAAYANTNTSLFKVSATGGEPVRLTTSDDSFSRPAFRPDGKALYAVFEVESDNKTYHLDRLAKFSWPNVGQPEILTAKLDRSVGSFAFTPDSKSIYLTAEEAGNEKLFTMPADGGEVTLAMDMTRGVYTNLRIPAKASSTILIANWESAINPPEVFRLDLKSKTQQPLTSFNAEQVAKIDWQPLRHFWFTSKAGKRIHNMIALPPNFDERKKYPLFVVMHGGPHSMWRDNWGLRWNYFMLSRPGYVVLLTNYSGSTGFGEAFAQSIQGDPFKGPGNEINEAADEAIRLYPFVDGSRQAAAGASYGGHMANWMQATTTRYKALISHAGLINLESQWGTSDTIYSREVNNGGPVWEQGPIWREQNPIRFAKNFRTPILLVSRRERFPRAAQSNAGKLERAATTAHSEPPDRLAGREPLDFESDYLHDRKSFLPDITGWYIHPQAERSRLGNPRRHW